MKSKSEITKPPPPESAAPAAPKSDEGGPAATKSDVGGRILHSRRRRGKIAHFSRALREHVNEMLRDGLTYAQVIAGLGNAGKALNVDNVRGWHSGGYKDWLKHQDWLDQMQTRLDFACHVLENPDSGKLREASLSIAIKQMYDLLADFDPAPYIQKLADEPQN